MTRAEKLALRNRTINEKLLAKIDRTKLARRAEAQADARVKLAMIAALGSAL